MIDTNFTIPHSEMIGVLGHYCALYDYNGPGTTWAYDMDDVMNQALGAGSIATTC